MKHKKNKKKKPLKFYLATGFLIFSAILLVVLWLFQTVFLESFYKAVKTSQVKSCANAVGDRINTEDFYELNADIEAKNDMYIAVFKIDDNILGMPIYLSENRPSHTMINSESNYKLLTKARDNNGEYTYISEMNVESKGKRLHGENNEQPFFGQGGGPQENGSGRYNGQDKDGSSQTDATESAESATENSSADESEKMPDGFRNDFDEDDAHQPSLERRLIDYLTYVKIFTVDEQEYLVIVESEITPVTSVVDTLRYQLIIMTVVIVLFSVVMAIIVAKVISKPISDAADKAKELADQNYDLTFSGGKYREIAELNNSLSYAAQELKKVDDLQKELIANISHDLRTPLTMITGYAEIMRDLPGEATPENVQIIIDEANRLNNLVTDLLDISRLRSGTADLKMTPFSLTDCIKNIFARYQKLVENDGLNIVFEHDCEVFVRGDELRMTQVLYNLVNNAVNYIGEDKTVIVRQTVSDGMVKIEVIDHGAGIPQEKLDYIWDRYYRVDKEHQRAVIGTGLGLSIVKNILLAHDADFGVASKLGSGSNFYFSLPVIDIEEEKEML